jgi:hypothetical protein
MVAFATPELTALVDNLTTAIVAGTDNFTVLDRVPGDNRRGETGHAIRRDFGVDFDLELVTIFLLCECRGYNKSSQQYQSSLTHFLFS